MWVRKGPASPDVKWHLDDWTLAENLNDLAGSCTASSQTRGMGSGLWKLARGARVGQCKHHHLQHAASRGHQLLIATILSRPKSPIMEKEHCNACRRCRKTATLPKRRQLLWMAGALIAKFEPDGSVLPSRLLVALVGDQLTPELKQSTDYRSWTSAASVIAVAPPSRPIIILQFSLNANQVLRR